MCSISFGDFITDLTDANIDTTAILTEIVQLDDTFSEIVIIEFYRRLSVTGDRDELKTEVRNLLTYDEANLSGIEGAIDGFQVGLIHPELCIATINLIIQMTLIRAWRCLPPRVRVSQLVAAAQPHEAEVERRAGDAHAQP